MKMIKIEGVTKSIKGSMVLENVSMTAESGVVTGLSGINGSGKTMLMRVIAALVKPSDGMVEIDGKLLWRDMAFPDSVGVLIENPAFLDTYTGFANLEMIASIRNRVGKDRIGEVIRKVGLDPDDKKKYRKYSLGMKQRLGIAAAILEEPEIVLLDEPTNALDSAGVDILKDIVFEEKARGATVVITCHDQVILHELADKVYFMESGRIVGYEDVGEEVGGVE
ncbi:multidrug ABC transporter ATP-binding protein [Eggerthella sinensis]|uniref:Multidrug ABC transporter ATP-binding protein n=2 Tax=Eggerthella sinensis TaxID=242230 RepID=A0A3N0J0M6_9ACTN|nr:multidrug ABC transporter ATP-binding protein [Eggerthella sinensis]RNM42764.1 multidrug ABC transporter ATP-binding protein [Eggerthella sinensis]